MMKLVLTNLFVLLHFFVFGQNSLPHKLDLDSLYTINNNNYEQYTISDYSKAFDEAIILKKDTITSGNNIIGNVVLSALAKSLIDGIDDKRINANSKETRRLLKKFREYTYYMYQPEVNSAIKFFGYMCFSEYGHIYRVTGNNKFFLIIAIVFGLVLCFVLLHIFGKIRWRYQRVVNKIFFVLFVVSVLLSVVFKKTCDCNVSEYSFYGITIN